MSRFSKWHLKITPDECIQCKLCNDSCPVDAINTPVPEKSRTKRPEEIRKLLVLILLVPVIMLVMGYGISKLAYPLSRSNKQVSLANQIYMEELGKAQEQTLDSRAFRGREKSAEQLYKEAFRIQNQFKTGAWLLGFFIGLVLGLKLINVMIKRKRTDYEPDKVACISCGRCMEYCPVGAEENQIDRFNISGIVIRFINKIRERLGRARKGD